MKSMSIKALLLTLVIAGSAQAGLGDWVPAPISYFFSPSAPAAAPVAAPVVVAAPAKNQAEYIANLKRDTAAMAASEVELENGWLEYTRSAAAAQPAAATVQPAVNLDGFAALGAPEFVKTVEAQNSWKAKAAAPFVAAWSYVPSKEAFRAAPGKALAGIKATPGATKAFVVGLPDAVKAGSAEALVDTKSLWTNLNVFNAQNRDAFLNAFGRDAVKAAKVGLALAAMYYTGKACLFGINAARAKFASAAKEDKTSTSSVSASSSTAK